MGKIPQACIPPRDYFPEKIFPLPEVRLPRKLNLGKFFLDRHVDNGRGSKVAILYRDQRITFTELQKEVNRLANALRHLGLEKNDRMMLRIPNRPEFVVACLACWKLGAIPVLVNHLLRAEEIIFRANDSEAKALLVSSDTLSEVVKAKEHFNFTNQIIVCGRKEEGFLFYKDLIKNQSEQFEAVECDKEDWMRIIYSSGTTGKPKGIITSIGDGVAAIAVASKYLLEMTSEDVLGGHPAFTFAFGFYFILFFGYNGCTLSITEHFEAESMLQVIQDHRISVLRCVPTVFRMLLAVEDAEKKYDLSSLRLCQGAGEWMPGTVVKAWRKRFGVDLLDSVGSGDLNSFLSTRKGTPEDKLDSSGFLLPGVEGKIVDAQFREVPQGVAGELLIRAPWGQYYWRRPDKQKEGIKDGWNRTGLIYQEDEDGYCWLKGRNDEIIVSSGNKIPGGEVEATLLTHEAVLETAVVPSPDLIRGNIVKAFIVLKKGYQPSVELAEELKKHVKEKIESYKCPRVIEFVSREFLPRTVTGKIQRFILRDEEKKVSVIP
ncbi:MAG: acyl-CoA synthetase [Deltaproteobacteria bacterium]|nr:acyl-CoA synthetase [Deltaproteobacteria bacterium]